ncbi:MAG: hypothetical protein KC729_11510, partial [Candidatus Eisenbacteria bacterium]|nr:hypothetical protein [Candidatus Eisenbacteria bacterium]
MSQWNRRQFLRGAAGSLGMIMVPSFLTRTGNLFASPTPGDPFQQVAADLDGTYFAQGFGIDRKIIDRAMNAALERGGEFADLFFQHRNSSYVGLEDGAVNRAFSS